MAILSNVTFYFVKIQNPVKAFNKIDTEWTVDVVASKADATALLKQFPKTSLKKLDHDEFKEKFKSDPPFPNEAIQHVLKFKKNHIKNGKECPEQYRPRVLWDGPDGRQDITFTKLVGNGSKGDLSYRVKETDEYGNFVELQAILVKDLIEYNSKGVTSDFGDVPLAKAPEREQVVERQGETPSNDGDFDENDPF